MEKLNQNLQLLEKKLSHLESEHAKLLKERKIQGKFGQKQKGTSELEGEIRRVMRDKRGVLKKRKQIQFKLKKLKLKEEKSKK